MTRLLPVAVCLVLGCVFLALGWTTTRIDCRRSAAGAAPDCLVSLNSVPGIPAEEFTAKSVIAVQFEDKLMPPVDQAPFKVGRLVLISAAGRMPISAAWSTFDSGVRKAAQGEISSFLRDSGRLTFATTIRERTAGDFGMAAIGVGLLWLLVGWKPQPPVTVEQLEAAARTAIQRHPILRESWQPYETKLKELPSSVLRSLYRLMSDAAQASDAASAQKAKETLLQSQKYLALLTDNGKSTKW